MFFRQLFDPESSTLTYLLADLGTRQAIIIDPVLTQHARDLEVLNESQFELAWSLDTHVHADHVTGAAALKAATGCRTAVGMACEAPGYDRQLVDSDRIGFGNKVVQVLATPGHTVGSLTFRVEDRLFTGDALLIGGCGRTDFQNGSASALYDSVTRKLFALPGEMLVYPGHDYKGRRVSCIAEERTLNPRFAGRSRMEFEHMMAELNLMPPKLLSTAVPANKQAGGLHAA